VKKAWSAFLIVLLILVPFTGCDKTEKLTEGKNNDKLVGAWILINETGGFIRAIRYWEFKSDNTVIMCDAVETAENDARNDQLYEEAPLEDAFKTYYIKDTAERKIYTYSYSDGHGLEYQISEDNIATFTEEEGWHFSFLNANKFYLTTEISEYHGYRLKAPLLNND